MQTILVIDDDDALRKTVACVLQRNGFNVVEARSGAEGIKLAQAHRPVLILCDLNMEEGNGSALVTIFRADPHTANIPFVLMTGQGEQDRNSRQIELADEFLAKPFTVTQLIGAVNSGLKQKERRRPSSETTQKITSNQSSSGPVPTKNPPKLSREQLEALSRRLQLLLEKERSRVARAIHDDLSQVLTVLALEMSILDSNLKEPIEEFSLADCRKSLRKLTPLVEGLIESAQKITAELRPKILEEFGLAAGLEWLVEQFHKRSGIKCEFHPENPDAIADIDVAMEIYRLTEEILSNVGQHAKATFVKISLDQRAGRLRLEVKDNGKGITARQIADPKSLGLLAMAKRMEYSGGEFTIIGQPGKGTTVIAQVPLKPVHL